MQITELFRVGGAFSYQWPKDLEKFDRSVRYRAIDEDGIHDIKIGFGIRKTYGEKRARIVVWIDKYPEAEFVGADDFKLSGDVLSEIKVRGGQEICRYGDDSIPARYAPFHVVGLKNRIRVKGVRNAWAVVANVADHKTMVALAALRRLEKKAKA
jgi:hypothetical protein